MKKIHALTASIILSLAAIFGVAAVTNTAGLSAAARTPKVSSATIHAQARKLDRVQRALRKARAQRPPALPPVPRTSPVVRRAPRVVYTRPAPVAAASSHGEHEDEHESEHEDEYEDD